MRNNVDFKAQDIRMTSMNCIEKQGNEQDRGKDIFKSIF